MMGHLMTFIGDTVMTHPTGFKFINALIKALPIQPTEARSTDSEYSDSKVSGSKCLVGKREGSRHFLFRYIYHGRKRDIAIGLWPEVDVALARQLVLQYKRTLVMGQDRKDSKLKRVMRCY